MSGFKPARDRLIHELPCACDVADAPSREGQIPGRRGSRVDTEAELGFAISLGVVDSQSLFAMRPRLREIAFRITI